MQIVSLQIVSFLSMYVALFSCFAIWIFRFIGFVCCSIQLDSNKILLLIKCKTELAVSTGSPKLPRFLILILLRPPLDSCFHVLLCDSCIHSYAYNFYFFSDLVAPSSRLETLSSERVTLQGHCGAVYHTCFSPDNTILLSSSEDASGK